MVEHAGGGDMSKIEKTHRYADCGESVIHRYHAQDIQATEEEFVAMLVDGLTPTERRLQAEDYIDVEFESVDA